MPASAATSHSAPKRSARRSKSASSPDTLSRRAPSSAASAMVGAWSATRTSGVSGMNSTSWTPTPASAMRRRHSTTVEPAQRIRDRAGHGGKDADADILKAGLGRQVEQRRRRHVEDRQMGEGQRNHGDSCRLFVPAGRLGNARGREHILVPAKQVRHGLFFPHQASDARVDAAFETEERGLHAQGACSRRTRS